MGNANGGGSGSFRGEHIISSSYHTRALGTDGSGSGGKIISHDGVVVHT